MLLVVLPLVAATIAALLGGYRPSLLTTRRTALNAVSAPFSPRRRSAKRSTRKPFDPRPCPSAWFVPGWAWGAY